MTFSQLLAPAYQNIMNGPDQAAIAQAIGEAGLLIHMSNSDGVEGWKSNAVAAVQNFIDGGTWLSVAKRIKLQALNDTFDAIRDQGRIIGQKTYQIDDASFATMQSYWNNNVWPIQWITMDDSTINLTQTQFQNGAQNILQYLRAMRANKSALKGQINAAASASALAAIDINGGWPSNP